MTDTTTRKDFDLDYLLHPARVFRTPMDVVTDPDLSVPKKRAILASWASDACAVEAAPDLRSPPSAAVVRFDDVMDALKCLDGDAVAQPRYGQFFDRAQRWKDLYRGDGLDRRRPARRAATPRALRKWIKLGDLQRPELQQALSATAPHVTSAAAAEPVPLSS